MAPARPVSSRRSATVKRRSAAERSGSPETLRDDPCLCGVMTSAIDMTERLAASTVAAAAAGDVVALERIIGRHHPLNSRIAVVHLDDPSHALAFLTDATRSAWYPDWHPTESRIVFEAGSGIWWDDISTATSDLFVIDADGSNERRLTSLGPEDPVLWMPAWTADGTTVLATRTVRGTRDNDLVLVPLDSTAPRPIGIGGAHAREQRAPRP
jgi:hypothetical protein